jgi:hypothetical protein
MTEPTISRRQAAILLLGTGTAVGISAFFPSKWAKPIVKMGVLPVHAQTSTPTPEPTTPPTTGSIDFYFFNQCGDGGDINPVEDEEITVDPGGMTGTTGSNGHVIFNGLTPGSYTITAPAFPTDIVISDVPVSAGGTTNRSANRGAC